MPFDVLGFGFSCTLAGLSPAGVTRLARGACRGTRRLLLGCTRPLRVWVLDRDCLVACSASGLASYRILQESLCRSASDCCGFVSLFVDDCFACLLLLKGLCWL
jgi:hypothetical protein